MPNTYAIYNDIEAAEQLLTETYDIITGEIKDEAQFKEIDKLRQEIQALGLENLCKVRANKLADVAALKAEIDRLTERAKRADAEIDRLENYINIIYQQGSDPVQNAGNFTISTRKSTQVIIDAAFADDRFITVKTMPTVDKKAVKEALIAGEQINGAHLQTNYNLQIR